MPGPMELDSIRAKLKQLEQEADNRTALVETGFAHDEATIKKFMLQCFATAVAWATSQTIFVCLEAAVFDDSEETTALQVLIARLAYAIMAILVCPLVLWVLRPEGSTGAVARSFFTNFRTLVTNCVPMILSWGKMEVFVAFLNMYDNTWWVCLLVALVLTLVVSILELLPCYMKAQAGIEGRGDGDTILNRFLSVPGYLTLSIGRAWNIFLTTGSTALKKEVAGMPHIVFLIQLVYFIIIKAVVTGLTARWSRQTAALQKKATEEEENTDLLTDAEHHLLEMELIAGGIFISSMGFINAWALSYTLNDFFFGLLFGCSSASECSPAFNFLYAAIITVVFSQVAMLIQYEDRKEPWGKASQTLEMLAMSLCVGWGWQGDFNTTIQAIQEELAFGKVICYVLMLAFFWIFAGLYWHAFVKEKLRRKMHRQRDYKKCKVSIRGPSCASSAAANKPSGLGPSAA
mmetsp:Transcript_135676/g.377912  ORF Transcript_135676/g.377912 Transcript_135676/m.377912 type:complete len:461 (+) Transcript_135676:105-1487(+)